LIASKQRERLALTAVLESDSELRAMPAVETRSVLGRLLAHLEPKDRLLAQLLKRQNRKVLVNGEPQIWTGVNFWSRTGGPDVAQLRAGRDP
jgi:hypothetical protein